MTAPTFRRHDLDALRAVAMLLGIALHATLAYVPGIPWPVQDTHKAPVLGLVFLAIHGFRMPLFFLLSGFFTAMLWEKRGAAAMLAQRYQRVFVPLVLGSVTLLPLFTSVTTTFGVDGAAAGAPARPPVPALVAAIRDHDPAAVSAALAAGADASAPDGEFRMPPLWFAALEGDAASARLLLDAGADPRAVGSDGRTPLHVAAFAGRRAVAEVLLEAGADPLARGPEGDTPLDSTRADPGTTAYIAGVLRVTLDAPETLRREREAIAVALAARGGVPYDVAPPLEGLLDRLRGAYRDMLLAPAWSVPLPPKGERQSLVFSDAFSYLWFLWFLCWFAVLFTLVATLAPRLGLRRLPRRLVTPPLALAWVVPLTLLPQLVMGVFGPFFGPDTSSSLLPQPHLLLYYGIFFGYGSLLFLSGDDGAVGRHWVWALAAALVLCLPAGVVTIGRPALTALPQVLYTWLMCFGAIGFFRWLVPAESRAWRYLSDSAYWLYLVHMPLLVVLQRATIDWPLPGLAKFVLVCVAATAILLASYQLLVRHTPLGWLLNGPRGQRRSRAATSASS